MSLLDRIARRPGEAGAGTAPASHGPSRPTPAALAEGGDQPTRQMAGGPPAEAGRPGLRARLRLRRRVRDLERRREEELRGLGGLVFELQRRGRQRPDLVERKLEALGRTDAELRAALAALGGAEPEPEPQPPSGAEPGATPEPQAQRAGHPPAKPSSGTAAR